MRGLILANQRLKLKTIAGRTTNYKLRDHSIHSHSLIHLVVEKDKIAVIASKNINRVISSKTV